MGDRASNTEEQQCKVNSSPARKHNKCWGMEEAIKCLQRRKYQTQEKGDHSRPAML